MGSPRPSFGRAENYGLRDVMSMVAWEAHDLAEITLILTGRIPNPKH